MIKPINRATGDALDLNAVLPSSNAQKYLQAYYTAPFKSAAEAMAVARRRRWQRVVGGQCPL